jgi:hypothetical protein
MDSICSEQKKPYRNNTIQVRSAYVIVVVNI